MKECMLMKGGDNRMGRLYDGDITGKFWVAVQSSDDASFFGGRSSEPRTITYAFGQDDLTDIEHGIAACRKALGDNKARLDAFFAEHRMYTDPTLVAAGFREEETPTLLEWYARLELGEKIRDCVKAKGSCCFETEY